MNVTVNGPTSPEFERLCQSQIYFIAQVFGASWIGVYVTKTWRGLDGEELVPVAVYPQMAQSLEEGGWDGERSPLYMSPKASEVELGGDVTVQAGGRDDQYTTAAGPDRYFPLSTRAVLPLVAEELVLGLLVSTRSDRPWQETELEQLKQIAQAIALACVLDRRQQWYEEQWQQEQQLRRLHHEYLEELLHQLRNPITALKTFSKLLVKRLLPGDKNHRVAQGVLRESKHLQGLLDQFSQEVQTQQPEPGPLPGQQSPLSLPAPDGAPTFLLPSGGLTLGALALDQQWPHWSTTTQAIAAAQNRHFSTVAPDDGPWVQGNGAALQEVLQNLLSNALKYTPPGGEIRLDLRHRGDWVGIAVADNGPGIPPEDQPWVFDRRFRGIQAQGDIEGTGLGLAIARDLVQQMGGELELISPDLEFSPQGTTFIVWLPKAIAPEEDP